MKHEQAEQHAMKLELNRHRDHEGHANWDDAEPCQICGKLLIDVWTIYDGDKTHAQIGRECMKKALGYSVHPSLVAKAEAEYAAQKRKANEAAHIAKIADASDLFTNDEMASMMVHAFKFRAVSWIAGLNDRTYRTNTLLALIS